MYSFKVRYWGKVHLRPHPFLGGRVSEADPMYIIIDLGVSKMKLALSTLRSWFPHCIPFAFQFLHQIVQPHRCKKMLLFAGFLQKYRAAFGTNLLTCVDFVEVHLEKTQATLWVWPFKKRLDSDSACLKIHRHQLLSWLFTLCSPGHFTGLPKLLLTDFSKAKQLPSAFTLNAVLFLPFLP